MLFVKIIIFSIYLAHPTILRQKGVIEVAYKEILKNVNCIFQISLLPAVLDAVSNYNNNIHTTTKYKPCYLFENSNDEIYREVIENIKKR